MRNASQAKPPQGRRKWLGNGLMGLYGLFLLVMIALTYRACADYFEIEGCLEKGGRWNVATEVCEER